MIINKGEPWIVWPKKYSHGLCKEDINNSLQGDNDFTLGIEFKLLSEGSDKRTIFSRLPNYLGLDIEKENNNVLFISVILLFFFWRIFIIYTLIFIKTKNFKYLSISFHGWM